MALWHDFTHANFWLELARSDLATWIQLTPYAYAAIEGIHLVGIAFFFGSVFLLDMKLLGVTPHSLGEAADGLLLRICVPAFAVVVLSGGLLFVSSADRYAASTVFLIKMGAAAVGGLNALVFQVLERRHAGARRSRTTRGARLGRTTAVVSLLVWLSVIVLGRWMGYERRTPAEVDFDILRSFDAPAPLPND